MSQSKGQAQKALPVLDIQHTSSFLDRPFKPAIHPLTRQGRKVHGKCTLPEGYELSVLPAGTQVDEMDGSEVFEPDERPEEGMSTHRDSFLFTKIWARYPGANI